MSDMTVSPRPADAMAARSVDRDAATCGGSACHQPAADRTQCPWQSQPVAAALACVALRAIDGMGMLAVRRVETSRGAHLHAQLSPRWPGCASASSDPDQLNAYLPAEGLPILCDLRHGAMSDFPGVLLCCLRVASSSPGSSGRIALLVADGAGEAQSHWMEALAGAVGVQAQTFVDADAAIAWMQG